MDLTEVDLVLRSYGYKGNKLLKHLAYLRDWGLSGSLSQMWYDWLGMKGYTGTLLERRNAFDIADLTEAPDPEAPPPPGPIAFSSGFSSGFH